VSLCVFHCAIEESTFITALNVVTNTIESVQHYLDKENEEGMI
jgi:cyanophycin synthetase